MDASFESRAEQLANKFSGQATTIEERNGLMRFLLWAWYNRRRLANPGFCQLRIWSFGKNAAASTRSDSHSRRRGGAAFSINHFQSIAAHM